ncbi:hypothetical protein EMIT079MI2_40228 [Bacillus sp. IT-79MI2]
MSYVLHIVFIECIFKNGGNTFGEVVVFNNNCCLIFSVGELAKKKVKDYTEKWFHLSTC